MQNATRGIFAAPGYLLFTKDNTLFAQAFEPKGLRLLGQPSGIATDVAENPTLGQSSVAVSNTGMVICTNPPRGSSVDTTSQSHAELITAVATWRSTIFSITVARYEQQKTFRLLYPARR